MKNGGDTAAISVLRNGTEDTKAELGVAQAVQGKI